MNKKKKWEVGRLLSGILALLGFAGCNGEAPCLYGTPSVDYRVLGTVTDEQGKPLKDIQVIVNNPNSWSYYDDNASRESLPPQITPDTLYTDKKGNFTSRKAKAFDASNIVVEFKDIDGEVNGGDFLEKRLTKDKFNEKKIKKGNGFYEGEYEYSQTVQLQRKDK